MSVVRIIKNTRREGFDLRDFLFLLCAAIGVYGVFVVFGLGAACVVGGGAGMWVVYASTPEPEVEQEVIEDPKAIIKRAS